MVTNQFAFIFTCVGRISNRCFKAFKKAILYIGKGTAWRDNWHFYNAMQFILLSLAPYNAKARAIIKHWKEGDSLVVRKLAYGISSFEASSNEMATIKALGLSRLTNAINGTHYCAMKDWTEFEIQNYANVMLYNCMEMLHRGNPTYLYYDTIKNGN